MLWKVQTCFLLVNILNLYKMKLPVFRSSVLQKSAFIENQCVDGTAWLKGWKSSVLELRWGEFHPHQAIRCRHTFRACWWSWPASPALLVSGVDYSGAKSGFSLNTAAHFPLPHAWLPSTPCCFTASPLIAYKKLFITLLSCIYCSRFPATL